MLPFSDTSPRKPIMSKSIKNIKYLPSEQLKKWFLHGFFFVTELIILIPLALFHEQFAVYFLTLIFTTFFWGYWLLRSVTVCIYRILISLTFMIFFPLIEGTGNELETFFFGINCVFPLLFIIKQEWYIYNFYFDNFSYKCFTIKQRKYYNYEKFIYFLQFNQMLNKLFKCKYNSVD